MVGAKLVPNQQPNQRKSLSWRHLRFFGPLSDKFRVQIDMPPVKGQRGATSGHDVTSFRVCPIKPMAKPRATPLGLTWHPRGSYDFTSGMWELLVAIYTLAREVSMAKNAVAKLFRNGRSQAVRLPREFRFEGDRVRIRRTDQGVLLEPLISDAAKWFEELDRFDQERFLVKGRRNQPITPRREIFE